MGATGATIASSFAGGLALQPGTITGVGAVLGAEKLLGGESGGAGVPADVERSARQQARTASFGIENTGGLAGRSREQVENEIFHGIINDFVMGVRKAEEEEQARIREEEEKKARAKASRDTEIETAQKRPGRRGAILTTRTEPNSGLSGFLVG